LIIYQNEIREGNKTGLIILKQHQRKSLINYCIIIDKMKYVLG